MLPSLPEVCLQSKGSLGSKLPSEVDLPPKSQHPTLALASSKSLHLLGFLFLKETVYTSECASKHHLINIDSFKLDKHTKR